jgi:hypothetical protein
MSFLPLHFRNDQDSSPIRTVWNGTVLGWRSSEDLRRFNGAISNVVKALTGKDFPHQTVRFTTRAAYDMFTATFPQGQDNDVILASLKELGVDVDAIRVDLADEEPAPPPTGAPAPNP